MSEELSKLVSELEKISDDAKTNFGSLSAEQINWRPSETGWSVGQCFEHLIKTNEMFFDELDKIGSGNRKNTFLESFSPLSGFFGSFLIKSLKKDERKFKTSQEATPPSDIAPNIIEIFAAHQAELVGKIERTENIDWKKTKVTSPFFSLATYTLSDGYTVIVEHEKRHFRQAERVTKEANFPK